MSILAKDLLSIERQLHDIAIEIGQLRIDKIHDIDESEAQLIIDEFLLFLKNHGWDVKIDPYSGIPGFVFKVYSGDKLVFSAGFRDTQGFAIFITNHKNWSDIVSIWWRNE